MPQISPWWCPHTDKMFPTKERYVAHLKELAVLIFKYKKTHIAYNNSIPIVEGMTKCSSTEELSQYIMDNSMAFYAYGFFLRETVRFHRMDANYVYDRKEFIANIIANQRWLNEPCAYFEFTKVEIKTYNSRENHTIGQIVYQYKYDPKGDYGRPFENTKLKLGSGSGTSSNGIGKMGYQIIFQHEDWPSLFVTQEMVKEY